MWTWIARKRYLFTTLAIASFLAGSDGMSRSRSRSRSRSPGGGGTTGGVRMVSLKLEVRSHPSNARDACSGGDAGLTETSIYVEYRLIQGSNFSEWRSLFKIDPKIRFDETLELPPHNESLVEGVQFRLLQLEHGGGSCNCWNVHKAEVMWDGKKGMIRKSHCSRMPIISRGSKSHEFCNGIASRARGFISTATGEQSVEMCPGSSDTMLILSKGLPLPQNCSTNTPRM